MQKKETAIEVKVGALVLFSVALLVAFVLVLGDFSFGDGFRFHVEFGNAGGLKPGADVAIAGINAGTVEELRFIQKGEGDDVQGAPVGVRATVRLDQKYADAVREDSDYFITTRGVLGEQYIEIETRDFDSPPIEEGAVVHGVDPPRIDVIVAKASQLLTTLNELLENPEIQTKELIANTASLMGHVDEFVVANRDDLDATVDNVRGTSEEAEQLLASLNVAVEDGEALRAAIRDARDTARNAKTITTKVDDRVGPVVDDVAITVANARNLSQTADTLVADNAPRINDTVANVHTSTERLDALSADAQTVVARVEQGEGTVGALLADKAIYDDLKEILRVIKQRPWKIVWKE